jgi:diguanylate cyclase (GGDEF)-like protein
MHAGEIAVEAGRALTRGERFQRWGLIAIIAAMLAALWIFLIGVSSVQRTRLTDEAAEDLAQLNRAVSQQVESMFRSSEGALRLIEVWLQAHPDIDPGTDRALARLVDELRLASDGLIALEFMPAKAGPGAKTLQIGSPTRNSDGNWSIPLSRASSTPSAGVAGAIVRLDLGRLVERHEKLRIKPSGSIVLVRSDGVLLSRVPHDPKVVGVNVASHPLVRSALGENTAGVFRGAGIGGDDLERIASFQRLERYPVSVLVTQSVSDVMAVYERRLGIALALLAVITLVVFGFTYVLHRSLLSLQMARRDMQRLAISDSLTGVMSRRGFLESAEREFTRARRYQRPCAVLMLDLDHFKRINDTYGHATGDSVLRECAAAWTRLLRDQDVLGRVGGEEFCAVLPETNSLQARQAAERMRVAVANLKFQGDDGPFAVTVSIGSTDVLAGDERLEQVMERADRALYLAKQGGRNRVESVEGLKVVSPARDSVHGK